MHEEDVRPPNEYHMLIILVLLTTDVNFAYWPLLQFLLSQNAYLKERASVNSWFHLPKILFSSLHLKLFDIAFTTYDAHLVVLHDLFTYILYDHSSY